MSRFRRFYRQTNLFTALVLPSRVALDLEYMAKMSRLFK